MALTDSSEASPAPPPLPLLSAPELPPLREARERFDRAYMEELLKRVGGNVSAAARIAGRNRTDFHALMKRLGLSGSDYRD